MAKIQFVDELPPRRSSEGPRKPRVWGVGIASQLKKHPGRWAHVDTQRSQTKIRTRAYAVAGATSPFQPKGSFEAAQRKQPTGEIHLYARYVGPNREHAEPDQDGDA